MRFTALISRLFGRPASIASIAPAEAKGGGAKSTFHPDVPGGVDRFGRAAFARGVAVGLVLPLKAPGLVIGMEGPWGSGKTFVIEQIKSILAESSLPIVLDFNPWIVSGTDTVVVALLEQLGTAIGATLKEATTDERAVKASSSIFRYLTLVRHLKYLKYVPGATAFGTLADDLGEAAERLGSQAKESEEDIQKLKDEIPKHDLAARKNAAIDALTLLDRPIVVIVDDLDRLPKEEIRSVFQAVKAVANFPRTAYLMSYDPRIAANALSDSVEEGLRYLEKIVQVQYPLPEPLPWRMKAFATSQLREALSDVGRQLTQDEQARFDYVTSFIGRLCRTPRDAIRIGNRLRVSLPATKGEVDACDVMLLEALAVCDNRVAQKVRERPEAFTGVPALDFEVFPTEYYWTQAVQRKETSSGNKEEVWRKVIDSDLSINTEAILRHLFPEDARLEGTLRVSNWDRLYRFLALGPAELLVEITDLQGLIGDEGSLQTALDDDRSAITVLRSLELYVKQLSISNDQRLVELLAAAATSRLAKAGTGEEWSDLASAYGNAIEQIIRNGKTTPKHLVERVIDTGPLSISVDLVSSAAKDLGIGGRSGELKEDQLIPDRDAFETIFLKFKNRVQNVLDAGVDLKREPGIYAVLYRLGQLGGDYTLSRAISKQLVSQGHLSQFLRATNLVGEFPVSPANLDLVWDSDELLLVLEREGNPEKYKKALDLLRLAQVRAYFSQRSAKPTQDWPRADDVQS